MDHEKLPSSSRGTELSQETTDLALTQDIAQYRRLCVQKSCAGLRFIPFLVPIKTQALHWTAAASTVAFSQTIRHLIPLTPLTAPILILVATLTYLLVIYLDQRHQTQRSTRARQILNASLTMLLTSEVIFPLRQAINRFSHDPEPPLPFRQALAFRFLLACFVVQALGHDFDPVNHIASADSGSDAMLWCCMPFTFLHVGEQWAWRRDDKLQGVCCAALGFAVLYVVARGLTFVLGVAPFPYVEFRFGAPFGCLARTERYWQIFAMQPVYTLVFWLCHQILGCVGKFADLNRGDGLLRV